ncbi:MAG: YbaN family protein [Roseburia sp.]|uniref:YbaN family protein n=1 Tax=Roseburia sp. 831b TaxID=1261635 RepID=UPI0009529F6C|nr:YbaN family protein [Roseburia sp. 831b]MCI5918089.1 YbaN family protein [Roseburia sp.]MDD6217561.1 YbaN family protein [Roseburia sp.]MDY5884434.1 YbaN family protein [Roseburia sp.]WVK73475.1 YbaN family protein [Roseburia sp. 831b]
MKRILFVILGCLSLGLGTVGIVLPLLPTVPFYLATVFFFANSSKRLHDWFTGTKMYRKHLESYVKKEGMTVRTKATIMASASLMMGIGFLCMSRVPIARIVLAVVWVCHIIYFVFMVKTIPESEERCE